MTKTIRTVVVVGSVLAMIAAFSPPTLGARIVVKATSDRTWKPAHKFVKKGTRVVWKNPTNEVHDVKSTNAGTNWRLPARRLSPNGGKTSKVFRKRGNYYYRCTLHDGMNGIIHVRRRL